MGEDGEARPRPPRRRLRDRQRRLKRGPTFEPRADLYRRALGAHDAADQVVVARLLDLHAHDLAGARLAAVDVDLAVDLRRLPHPAPLEQQVGLVGGAFDEPVLLPAHERLLMRAADLPLQAEQLLLPLRLDSLRKLPVEVVARGALLAGELEDADLLEPHLLDEGAQLAKLRFGLAGETGDEAGAEGEVGHALADLLHQPAHPGG